jgi:hypothetical protein
MVQKILAFRKLRFNGNRLPGLRVTSMLPQLKRMPAIELRLTFQEGSKRLGFLRAFIILIWKTRNLALDLSLKLSRISDILIEERWKVFVTLSSPWCLVIFVLLKMLMSFLTPWLKVWRKAFASCSKMLKE